MNHKIQKLKIANYKKNIFSEYSFLNIQKIFHGIEDSSNSDFSKRVLNSDKVKIKEFSIYDAKVNVYINETEKYKEALNYFKDGLKIFNEKEDVIFNVKYNRERFRIQCPHSKFISNFDNIKNFEESIIVYDKSLTKIISILRMEYSFEVSILL